MDKAELLALADVCEKLNGPNYAVDVEIFKAMHLEYSGYVQGRGGLVHPFDGSDQRVLSDVRPGNYTASIDDAMTLVPEGHFLRFYGEAAQAIIVRRFSGSYLEVSRSFGSCDAAVIVAAALRSHASAMEGEG